MKKLLPLYGILLLFFGCQSSSTGTDMELETTPKHLYKVMSIENWNASKSKKNLILSSEDDAFIHLAKKEQLDRITSKYWSDVSTYVVLTLDAKKLQGKLVFEKNPGGQTKYYHLYQGSIPRSSVVDYKIVNQ